MSKKPPKQHPNELTKRLSQKFQNKFPKKITKFSKKFAIVKILAKLFFTKKFPSKLPFAYPRVSLVLKFSKKKSKNEMFRNVPENIFFSFFIKKKILIICFLSGWCSDSLSQRKPVIFEVLWEDTVFSDFFFHKNNVLFGIFGTIWSWSPKTKAKSVDTQIILRNDNVNYNSSCSM